MRESRIYFIKGISASGHAVPTIEASKNPETVLSKSSQISWAAANNEYASMLCGVPAL